MERSLEFELNWNLFSIFVYNTKNLQITTASPTLHPKSHNSGDTQVMIITAYIIAHRHPSQNFQGSHSPGKLQMKICFPVLEKWKKAEMSSMSPGILQKLKIK